MFSTSRRSSVDQVKRSLTLPNPSDVFGDQFDARVHHTIGRGLRSYGAREIRFCEVGRFTAFVIDGPATIEFLCSAPSPKRNIAPNRPGIRRRSDFILEGTGTLATMGSSCRGTFGDASSTPQVATLKNFVDLTLNLPTAVT
jgi:hypothetical protein